MNWSTNPESAVAELRATALARPASQVDPQHFVLAIATRAHSLGLPDRELELFLRKQTGHRPGLAELINSPTYRWLVQQAQKASRSSSPSGRVRNARHTARLAAGRILSPIEKGTPLSSQADTGLAPDDLADPLANRRAEPANGDVFHRPTEAAGEGQNDRPKEAEPMSPNSQLRARVAMVVLTRELLESLWSEKAWNTAKLSVAKLSLATGWSATRSRAALRDVLDLGWASQLPTGKGQVPRYKISGRLSAVQREVASGQYEAIGRLMGRPDAESAAADLLASVGHPAWAYGEAPLGHHAWLVAVADAAGVHPSDLEVHRRHTGPARAALRAAGLMGEGDTTSIVERLDRYARQHGAFAAKKAAEAAYTDAAQKRVLAIAVEREWRQEAFAIAEHVLGSSTLIPHLDSPAKFEAWIARSRAAFDGMEYPADVGARVEAEVRRRIAKRLKGDTTKDVAFWMMTDAEIEDEPAERALRRTAARALDRCGASLAEVPNAGAGHAQAMKWAGSLRVQLNPMDVQLNPMDTAEGGDTKTLVQELAARLVYRGHSSEAALEIAGCVPAPAPAVGPGVGAPVPAAENASRTEAREALDALDIVRDKIPDSAADGDAKIEWADSVRAALGEFDLDATVVAALEAELTERLCNRGHVAEDAREAAGYIMEAATAAHAA